MCNIDRRDRDKLDFKRKKSVNNNKINKTIKVKINCTVEFNLIFDQNLFFPYMENLIDSLMNLIIIDRTSEKERR